MPNFFTTPTKTASVTFDPSGIYYGIVKRSDEVLNRVWVEIPRLTPDFDYGPLAIVGQILPPVGTSVACIFVEEKTEDIVVLGPFLGINDVTDSTSIVALATTSLTPIKTISGSLYRSAKFLIQVSRGSNYLLTEILAIHNGTTASFTEYGRVVVGTAPATFDVDFTGGNLVLKAASTSASATVYKIKTTAIAP